MYKLNKSSKTGKINRNRIIAGAAIITVIGAITVCGMAKRKANNYGYNEQFTNYSTQLEAMLDVKIDSDDAQRLDKLQGARDLISQYESGMGEFVEKAAISELSEKTSDLVDIGLDIAKTAIAKENGGTKDDYRIGLEKSDATWYAVKEGDGAITLSGEVEDLSAAIGLLQNYEGAKPDEIKDPDRFVNICDKLVVSAGEVTVDMAKER